MVELRQELEEEQKPNWLVRNWRVLLCLFIVVVLVFAAFKIGGVITCAKSNGMYVKHGFAGACVGLDDLGFCEMEGKLYAKPGGYVEPVGLG